MARSELVEKYRELVEQYDLLRQRIVKAEENRDKFKSSVVDRVIADYQSQMSALEEQLAPAEEEMFKSVDEFDEERAKLEAENDELDDAQDEVALRHVLGEYSYEAADEKKAELAAKLDAVNGRLSAIDDEVGTLREYLEKAGAWERREAAQRAAEGEQEPVAEEGGAPEAAQEPAGKAPEEHPGEKPIGDDLAREAARSVPSSLPESEGLQAAASQEPGAFEMILDDFPSSPVESQSAEAALESGVDDLKGLTDLDEGQWQKNLEAEFPPPDGLQDVLGSEVKAVGEDFPNLGFGDQLDVLPPLAEEPARAALLIRNLGQNDEQRYELRDTVTSIGRGRDNQIQIKDDTKVSRYHCRVLQEQGAYFVEDNNSSNGTMVNGELITRRKLEGGEDITIGETVFRFQLS